MSSVQSTWNTIQLVLLRIALLYSTSLGYCADYIYVLVSSSVFISRIQCLLNFPCLLSACSLNLENWWACSMFSLVINLDSLVDPKETTRFTPGAEKEWSLLLLNYQASYWMKLQIVYTYFECKIPSCARLPPGYSPCWVPGDIISHAFL